MRIIWHGVGPEQPTGYGVQTKLFTTELSRLGHEVIISNFNTSFGYTAENGCRVIANGIDSKMGNFLIKEHVRRIKPDLIMTMFDMFICNSATYKGLPWVAWNIIDCAPLHPQLKTITKVPPYMFAMSRFGQDVMAKAGRGSSYVPLAIDVRAYNYIPQQTARAILCTEWQRRIPERLVVMVAANMSFPSRKNFHGAFKAWRIWCDKNPGRGLMYCHTEVTGKQSAGEDLIAMAEMCGLTEQELLFPDQWRYNQSAYEPAYLRSVYSAADAFLCTSLGEGFCVPLVEAQACGCPAIAPAATATKELLDGSTGLPITDLITVSSRGASEQQHPSIANIEKCIKARLISLVSEKQRVKLARKYGMAFDIRTVSKKYLVPALANIERDMRQSQKIPKIVRKSKDEIETGEGVIVRGDSVNTKAVMGSLL